ncbi:MAG: MbnP family protein [Saprospiraceae bacterium]
MKNLTQYTLILLSLFATTFIACKKDDTDDFNTSDKGKVTLEFDNVVGNNDMELISGKYTNASGEDFTVTTFNYYISNISLTKEDGSTYVVPKNESYFLVKEADARTHEITLSNIPAGNYKMLNFTIGVDSLISTAEISQRTGVLDPSAGAQGMYWKWNSGYIFMKMEGNSSVAPYDSTSKTNPFWYHIGGFGGMTSKTINNIKKISIQTAASVEADEAIAKVRKETKPQFHITVDAAKIFNAETKLKIKEHPVEMFTPFSVNIANNYKSMFSLDHIHN